LHNFKPDQLNKRYPSSMFIEHLQMIGNIQSVLTSSHNFSSPQAKRKRLWF
jgi:hypothetical protein